MNDEARMTNVEYGDRSPKPYRSDAPHRGGACIRAVVATVAMLACLSLTACASQPPTAARNRADLEIQKQMMQDADLYVRTARARRARSLSIAEHSVQNAEASIPHSEIVTFPGESASDRYRRTSP